MAKQNQTKSKSRNHITETEKLISAVMKGNNVAGKAQLVKILKQKATDRIKEFMV